MEEGRKKRPKLIRDIYLCSYCAFSFFEIPNIAYDVETKSLLLYMYV